MAEEQILTYLLRNPDGLNTARDALSPEEFVTDFNRKVYALLLRKAEEGETPDFSSLSDGLAPEEMGKIAGLLAKSREMDNDPRQLTDSIRLLQEERRQLRPTDLKDSGDEELRRYYEELKQRKKQR